MKELIIKDLQEIAKQLEKTPTRTEYFEITSLKISRKSILKYFDSYTDAIEQAGLNKKPIYVNCDTCQTELVRTPSTLSEHNFCNHSCSAKYNNTLRKDKKYCKLCSTECNVNKNLTEYHYHNKDKTQYAAKCKTCRNNADVLKMRQLKDIFLKYKGEQCSVCGYNKCKGALEFHHLDPNEKEFNISDYKKIGINKEVLEELDRCIVLCSNCHRETHYND